MSPVRLIILLVAAAAAIGAVFLVRSMAAPAPAVAAAKMTPVEAEKPKEVPAKLVLVANHPIGVGKFVSADDLRWQEWPADAPAASFIDKEKNPEALEKMVGAVSRYPFVEGEPVTNAKLQHPGTSGFMAVMLSPGMRAVSIQIDAEFAAGGFIQPNDRVDVIVTREVENKTGGGQTANTIQATRADQILSNIRVLAIDAEYGAPPAENSEEPKTGQGIVLMGSRATLEMSDRDATLLNAARKAGEISLTLRSIADIQGAEGATGVGRVYRDGVTQDAEGVRVYRYGTESVSSAPAG
ncbi:MAG: Flp pilus assembly protein CpaB [Hyphomonadaceae bacterium]